MNTNLYQQIIEETLGALSDEPVSDTLKRCISSKVKDDQTGTESDLFAEVLQELEGLGPLVPLLHDPEVSEILINGFDTIFFEKEGKLRKSQRAFATQSTFQRILNRLQMEMQKVCDIRHPLADGSLKDGTRIHIALPPVAKIPTVSIRRHVCKEWSLSDLVSFGMVSEHQANLLERWVGQRRNILFCGATSSGKTTLMRTLLNSVGEDERVITIEDTPELNLKRGNGVSLVTRDDLDGLVPPITLTQLLKNSLRMRPDRLIVGEVRDGEALTLLDALSTGHAGSMCSLHARDPQGALGRLECLVSRAAPQWSLETIRKLIRETISIVVILEKKDGLRKVTQAVEVTGIESFGYLFKPLF